MKFSTLSCIITIPTDIIGDIAILYTLYALRNSNLNLLKLVLVLALICNFFWVAFTLLISFWGDDPKASTVGLACEFFSNVLMGSYHWILAMNYWTLGYRIQR